MWSRVHSTGYYVFTVRLISVWTNIDSKEILSKWQNDLMRKHVNLSIATNEFNEFCKWIDVRQFLTFIKILNFSTGNLTLINIPILSKQVPISTAIFFFKLKWSERDMHDVNKSSWDAFNSDWERDQDIFCSHLFWCATVGIYV